MRIFAIAFWLFAATVSAQQGNLDANSPAITQLKSTMAERHHSLEPYYSAGVVGLARDGTVALRDPATVPLAQRQAVSKLVATENEDRAALYREIARINGNPAWEVDIRATFAQRWIDRAPAGWWVQGVTGAWQKK